MVIFQLILQGKPQRLDCFTVIGGEEGVFLPSLFQSFLNLILKLPMPMLILRLLYETEMIVLHDHKAFSFTKRT